MTWNIVWGLLTAGAILGLHRAALWAEARGWIYYRTKRMPPGAGSFAMMEVATIVKPELHHVVEERRGSELRVLADGEETGEAYPDRSA